MGRNDKGQPEYLEVEIRVSRLHGREYQIDVDSPAGEAHAIMSLPFDEASLENQLLKLENARLRSGNLTRHSNQDSETTARSFGRALFEALFTGDIRTRYDMSQTEATASKKGLRLKLRLRASELAVLPWEYLYDNRQGEFLCLRRKTSLVRYPEAAQPKPPLRIDPPLRMLGIVSSPRNHPQLDTEHEKQRVQLAVDRLQREGLLELEWLESATWRELQRAMWENRWHVLHFIGHGGFDTYHNEGYVVMTDDEGEAAQLSAISLGRLLEGRSDLSLVVLNACEGAKTSKLDNFSSTASRLILQGIPAVLAMQTEISDRAAIEFSRVFYEALLKPLPIDEAVCEARKAISLALERSIEWGTPVLFMRTMDSVLVRFDRAPKPLEQPNPGPPAEPRTAPSKSRNSDDQTNELGTLFEWCDIPGGLVFIEDARGIDDGTIGGRFEVKRFAIAKFPVTNAQYKRFVESPDGYREKRWWEYSSDALHWWVDHPYPVETSFPADNHPRTDVSWYEALAFCFWLSHKTGQTVTLPTEQQWQRAALGDTGWTYPFGNHIDSERCNFNQNVGRTSAVDFYKAGASTYGVMDMSGNVWEWCVTQWSTDSVDLSGTRSRVVRGGAWNLFAHNVRAMNRFKRRPHLRKNDLGFRLVRIIRE